MATVSALFAGLLFGLGLMVSGMADPAKVMGFLDLFGLWNPSLIFVMMGAILLGAPAFFLARRRRRSILGLPMQIPAAASLTVRLIAGSAVFGIGWGLAGFCPGPALVSAAAGYPKAIGFVAAMIAGMLLFDQLERLRRR
ncbi:LPXTG cell wall anchor domain-containing protein [Herbaspirillum lusitanum]|uniref:DUF6691 family protein n=1 Tax=Herbaspirillum lusitanum TaxID=213312 RepID=UPI0022381A40|nr:DUF6691 family protein [Herbaspirillum lusitanum]MCW5298870.1 LPXTG cell wall anchor domain-containing protein [Herbaspirillum lusitanum]